MKRFAILGPGLIGGSIALALRRGGGSHVTLWARRPEAVGEVRDFWKGIGCRVAELPAAEHDECVALVSHLPHLLAATLINTVAAKNEHAFRVVGPGFRDSTRIAAGPPAMWREILRENSAA